MLGNEGGDACMDVGGDGRFACMLEDAIGDGNASGAFEALSQ